MTSTTIIVTLVFIIIVLFFLYVNSSVREVGEKLFSNHKSWAISIYLLLGIACYAIGYHFYTDENVLRALILRIGDLMIIGVLVGFVTNTARFLAVFKNSSFLTAYSEEELKKRKDIDEIWRTVSHVLFKYKFPKIKNQILDVINKKYFPNSEKGYYNDYHIEYDIKFCDEQKVYYQSEEHITFDYITDGTGKVEFNQMSQINKLSENDNRSNIEILSFKVNGIDKVNNGLRISRTHNNGKLKIISTIDVSGKTEYQFEVKYRKTLKFDDDHDMSFSSRRIAKDLYCKFKYSNDITAYFLPSGTLNEYTITDFNHEKEVKYKGLILPKQGYTFVLGRA